MTLNWGRGSFAWNTLPAILWPVLIFTASSIPSQEIPSSVIFLYDKLLHAGVFGVFCFLIYRAFVLRTPPFSTGKAMLVSVLLTVLYGITDEVHQMFVPGRPPEVYDLVADAVGGLVCVLIVLVARGIRQRVSPR